METKELVPVAVEKLVQESNLEKTKAQTVLDNFTEFFAEAAKWEAGARDIVITDVTQVEEMQKARTARLALKDIRVNAEKQKKKLKENILIEGRFIDAIYNSVVAVTKPIETELLEKEQYVQRIEEERLEKIRQERETELLKYEVDTSCFDLAAMSEAAYSQLLSGSKIAYETQKEAERKAEDDRIAREKAAAEEQERIRKENVRLKKEAEEREKERQKEQAKIEKYRAEQRAKEEEERLKHEEELKKIQAEKDAILEQERARREAEEKAERERKAKEAAEQRAKEEAERAASLAPDKEKLIAYCNSLLAVDRPNIKDEKLLNSIDMLIANINAVKGATEQYK